MIKPLQTLVADDVAEQESAQVERILHSDTLRTSEVLRHLFRYLSDKTIAGEADSLKEYTVAIDALQKPSTYNPKHDSTVRIQVSRLRLKLGEYYRAEGQDDPVVIDIPKGRFKLTFEPRMSAHTPVLPVPPSITVMPEPYRTTPARMDRRLMFVSFLLAVALAWAGYATAMLRHSGSATTPGLKDRVFASADVQKVWAPLLTNSRPLIFGIEDPLFMEMRTEGGIYFRDRKIDDWTRLLDTPAVASLRKLTGNPVVQPSHYYTTLGEVKAAFLMGKLLAGTPVNVSLVRSSELYWQELADSNILFVGKQSFFDAQIQGMPVRPPFQPNATGIANSNPRPGEPSQYLDYYTGAPAEEGDVYALVTRLPGPGAKGEFASFISNRSGGYVGALQWFTDPESAKTLVSKLSNAKGEFPNHYQVVLRVRFKDGVPTAISYVSSRVIE